MRCDPTLAADLGGFVHANTAVSFEELKAWADAAGWEYVDGGDTHLLLDGLVSKQIPSEATSVLLSRDSDEDREAIARFLALSDPDDVEASEFEIDELDPYLLGLVDADAQLGSLVGAREWEEDNNFDDIGILVRPDLRGKGWGSAVVSALCESSLKRGRTPLYRCNWSRGPSKTTALTLGFRQVGTLLAYRAVRLATFGLPFI